jgi:membrane protein YdbS with pleckstrin-like domain
VAGRVREAGRTVGRGVARTVGQVVVSRISADVPPRLDRYLLDTEMVVVAVRRHPAQVIEPVLTTVAALAFVLWATSSLSPDVRVVPDVLWVGWLLVLGRALWRLMEWSQDWFVATDTRLLLTYGILTRKVAMMPLRKVTDMSYNRSPLGRLLGYGEFVLESAGQDQAMRVVSWLPNPDELYKLICAEIFGRSPVRRAAAGVQQVALDDDDLEPFGTATDDDTEPGPEDVEDEVLDATERQRRAAQDRNATIDIYDD